jgi:LEA14-like dessication related protein
MLDSGSILPEGEGKIIGFLSAVAMSDSIQAADGNNTRTITMQGKSRTILQFNLRH